MKLVVGVSGGIDSVVLLHMLATTSDEEIIVAHVEHGIREDSRDDAEFVRGLAAQYDLEYVETSLKLGPDASEDLAREQRYSWLRQVMRDTKAAHIVTAHHQDDVIETMIINLLRGTGWRGLAPMGGRDIVRPLLAISKAEIISYAVEHRLEWRDDSTNDNVKYLRNYVRYRFVQRLTAAERQRWVELYDAQLALRDNIDTEITSLMPELRSDGGYSRYQLIMMGNQAFAQIIQRITDAPLERSIIEQLRHFVCTARPGKRFLQGGVVFRATARDLIVSTSDIC